MVEALPTYDSPIVGRRNEIDAALKLLRQNEPPVRLITFTGPGGIGKTRLALQVAAEWWQEAGGSLYFIPLASVSAPAMTASTIAASLGIQDTGSQPIIESIKDFLRGKQSMLVLDNYEHVMAASPLVADLLTASLQLKVLATSRAPLRIKGESEFLVPPLTLPDLDHLPSPYMLSTYAAVALFVQCAQMTDSMFSLNSENAAAIAEICTHLDGLPLAIELAAARIVSIPPEAMLERLQSRLMLLIGGRQFAARHQSLRATIDWSYESLSEGEKALFARTSVFSGAFALGCVEEICNADNDLPAAAQEILESLVTQSLLRVARGSERRYEMLETIREYARERLAERGEAGTMRQRHAEYFLKMAREAESKLRGPEQQMWLERLAADIDNLRAALAWALDSDEVELGQQLASALRWYWQVRGPVGEGRDWLARMLVNTMRTPTRAKALAAAGSLAIAHSDYSAAKILFMESMEIWQGREDSAGVAEGLYGLGRVAANFGDYSEAESLYHQSLALYRELKNDHGISDVLYSLGRIESDRGNYDGAGAFYEDSLKIRRQLQDKWGIAQALNGIAYAAADQYDHETSRALSEESLALYRELGDRNHIASMLFNLGYIAGEQGNLNLAESLYQEAEVIWQEIGSRTNLASLYRQWCFIAVAQGNLPRAQAFAAQCLNLFRMLGSKRGMAWGLYAVGYVAARSGRYDEAASLLEESLPVAKEATSRDTLASSLKELGLVALLQKDYARAAQRFKECILVLAATQEKKTIAEYFDAVARLAIATNRPLDAAWLWGAADSIRHAIGCPRIAIDQAEYVRAVSAARAACGDSQFQSAWEKGKAASLDEAIKGALELAWP